MPYVIKPTEELARLREECQVLKNLIRDIAENEASIHALSAETPHHEQVRLIADRILRRRALCAEIDVVLGAR